MIVTLAVLGRVPRGPPMGVSGSAIAAPTMGERSSQTMNRGYIGYVAVVLLLLASMLDLYTLPAEAAPLDQAPSPGAQARYNRGVERAGSGDHRGAIEEFDNAIRLDSRAPILYVGR